VEAKAMLDDMHTKNLACIQEKNNISKKQAYLKSCSVAQRHIKEVWWAKKATTTNSGRLT